MSDLFAASPAGADDGCDLLDAISCQTATSTNGHSVAGWLIVKHRGQEAALSAAVAEACKDCRWLVTQMCQEQTGAAGPDQEHCNGVFVGCAGSEIRFRVLFSSQPVEPLHEIEQYCYADPDGGVVTAATVAPDVRRYAAGLQVTTPSLRTWPPDGTTLVNLPTYFAAAAPGSGEVSVGGQGYDLEIAVGAARFLWSFGDGETLATTDPGAGPPDGAVHHTYTQPGTEHVTVTVEYGATYSVVTPFGTFGPQTVDGGPVRTVPAAVDLQVREAHAGLTG